MTTRELVEARILENEAVIERIKGYDPHGARVLAMMNKYDRLALDAGEYDT